MLKLNKLLRVYNIAIAKQHVVIINRSNIVGKPLAAMLLALDATVTICHSKTKDIKKHCLQADIIVSAVGQIDFLDASFVKPNAVIIDVAINWNKQDQLVGDVKINSLQNLNVTYSPVPGGVGPMTVAVIFDNLLLLAIEHERIKQKIHQ